MADNNTTDQERLARLDVRMMSEQYWGSLKEVHADCRFLRRLLLQAERSPMQDIESEANQARQSG